MKFKSFLRDNVELFLIVPLIAVALAAVWYWSYMQGTSMLELGAILIDYLVALLPVTLLGYLAWRWKKEYWYDLTPEDEERLHIDASHGNWSSFWLIVKDRLEWLVMFAVLYGAFTSLAGANPHARELVIRWEVTSQATYSKRYIHPVWPGGASGVTWGIGYDGGHQPAHLIAKDWGFHHSVDRLVETAGVVGENARRQLPRYRDIATTWTQAVHVLDKVMLPRYESLARQAYGRHFAHQDERVQAALISEVLNRGVSMAGDRRKERRYIRDVCLPAADAECVAQQLELSCRVWAGTPNGPGLCNRRRAEARVARG